MALPQKLATDIVLVDDNPDDAELIQYALSKYNIALNAVHFSDGETAFNYLQDPANPLPRVILLDIKLPKMDGLEILSRLRANARTRHTPVVMLSSSSSEQDIYDSYMLGANSYVVKPIDFDEFQAAIRTLGFYWLMLNERMHGLRGHNG